MPSKMHTVTCICPPLPPTPAEAKPSHAANSPVKSPCISTCLPNAKGMLLTDAHTTYCHTYIHREVHMGGRGPAPSPPTPHPRGSQAKPCCQARPTGSPCISRCHLNAYGHLHLSPSNPTPAEAKPSQAMLPTPPVKSPCISMRLLNAYSMLFLRNAVPYV